MVFKKIFFMMVLFLIAFFIWKDVYGLKMDIDRIKEELIHLEIAQKEMDDVSFEEMFVDQETIENLFQELFLLSKTLQMHLNTTYRKQKDKKKNERNILLPDIYEIVFSGIKDVVKSEYLLLVIDSIFQQKKYQNFLIKQVVIEKSRVTFEIEIYGLKQQGVGDG